MIGSIRRWRRNRRIARYKRAEAPEDPALARYVADYELPDDRAALSELRFVVVDTETTGLDIANDRILTIAGIVVEGGALRPGESVDLTVAHDHVGSDAATIHGLVPRDLVDGLDELTALGRFLELLGRGVLVAHHAAFDVGILDHALRRHGGSPILNEVIDTEVLVRRLTLGPIERPTTERFTLDAVALRYGLETEARHTAAGDALITAELLLRLLARAQRAGLRRLRDLRG